MFQMCANPNAKKYVMSNDCGATWSTLLQFMKRLQSEHNKLTDFEIAEEFLEDIVPVNTE